MSDVGTFVAWVRQEALPAWAELGFDDKAGRFHERLDFATRPLGVPHRTMVQARQIYVYAHAARLGWFAGGGALAERAMDNLMHDHAQTSGGATSFGYSLDPATGHPISAARDSYTHAFVLFALAHLFALTGDKALLATAERTTRYIEQAMVDPLHGGVVDDAAHHGGAKRQNPQMHLLEAYLALHDVAPDLGYAQRANGLVDLFYAKMCSPEHGVLIEHFARDWAPHPSADKRERFEPGHHYEWVWLLRQHERTTPSGNHGPWRERLYESAHRHGLTADGLILDELLTDKAVAKPSHRLWPHTEAIKAAAVRHGEGDATALEFANTMANALMRRFVGRPFAAGWIDQLSRDLDPLVDYVPASSLYHLMLAATEAEATWNRQIDPGLRFTSERGPI